MRWTHNAVGDIRLRRKFAWFPMRLSNSNMTVWLEWVIVKEKFVDGDDTWDFWQTQKVALEETSQSMRAND